MNKTYSTIIFDFDGTIADSIHLMIDIFNSMAHRFHADPVGIEQIEYLRGLTIKELIHELKIPILLIPEFLFIGKRMMKKRIDELKPVVGISHLIEKLSKKYTLGILTSNDAETVEEFLLQHDLNHFKWIHSETSIFGKDKALRKRLKSEHLVHKEVLYIGDEIRDVESCKKVGIDVASVAWGLNSHTLLESASPTYIVDDPSELEALLLKDYN